LRRAKRATHSVEGAGEFRKSFPATEAHRGDLERMHYEARKVVGDQAHDGTLTVAVTSWLASVREELDELTDLLAIAKLYNSRVQIPLWQTVAGGIIYTAAMVFVMFLILRGH